MGLDIGIDLGTSSILVYVKNKGIVFNEASVVAYNTKIKKIVAVGESARRMIGKTPPNLKIIRPIMDGVISDYIFARDMLLVILKRVCKSHIIKPRISVCIPSVVTGVEKNAIVDALVSVGARKIYLIDEPVAAAMGSGIDISQPKGRLIVDIGGGSSDIAVLSLNGIVSKTSIRVAGDKFDQAIIKTIKNKYDLIIGENTAKKIKEQIGNVYKDNCCDDNLEICVKGKHFIYGLPASKTVCTHDIFVPLHTIAMEIIGAIKSVVEHTPPDLLGDIQSQYLLMTGGGCKLKGLDKLIERHIKIKTFIPDNTSECVVIGTGKSFEFLNKIDEGLVEANTYKRV